MEKITIIFGIFFIALILITGCFEYDTTEQRYDDTREKMDTFVTIILYSSDEDKANNAIEAAYKRIDEIISISNRFNESSELSILNSNGIIKNPSSELIYLIKTSIKYNSITNGAFDITILPLLDLWSSESSTIPFYIFNMSLSFISDLESGFITDDFKDVFSNHDYLLNEIPEISYNNDTFEWTVKSGWIEYRLKNESDILNVFTDFFWNVNFSKQDEYIINTKKYVGSEKILISNDAISIEPGMRITLDGIAKGYAVDAALEVLIEKGIEMALVNAGGDIATYGSKPNDEKWITALRNPDNSSDSIIEFGLIGEAIATSGDYERYYNESVEIGHIMSPNSGRSVTLCSSSTIIADNCTIADILATAVFVLGPNDGVNLIDDLDGVETIVLGYENPQELFYSKNLIDFRI